MGSLDGFTGRQLTKVDRKQPAHVPNGACDPTETLAAPERIMLDTHRRMVVGMRFGQPSQTARGAAAYRAVHQILEGGVKRPVRVENLGRPDSRLPE